MRKKQEGTKSRKLHEYRHALEKENEGFRQVVKMELWWKKTEVRVKIRRCFVVTVVI